jgi:hypothetical protein
VTDVFSHNVDGLVGLCFPIPFMRVVFGKEEREILSGFDTRDLDPRPVGRFQLALRGPELKICHMRVVSSSEESQSREDTQRNLRHESPFFKATLLLFIGIVLAFLSAYRGIVAEGSFIGSSELFAARFSAGLGCLP